MKFGSTGLWMAWLASVCMALSLVGCAEMREGETNVPGRLRSGLEGGGKLGGTPSGVFENR
ncbi:MAG: hypothetical protein FJ388_09240 [Verrucomicrobia bacterium]|nr:hypothetical protein [Verrucomicrobiota bacterium]